MKSKVVSVSLPELISCDLESFLDLLEELWMADYEENRRGFLANISYSPVGVEVGTDLIQILVMGEEEHMEVEDEMIEV